MWGQTVSPPEVGIAPQPATLEQEKGQPFYVSAPTSSSPIQHSNRKERYRAAVVPGRVIPDPRPTRRNFPLPTVGGRKHHGNMLTHMGTMQLNGAG